MYKKGLCIWLAAILTFGQVVTTAAERMQPIECEDIMLGTDEVSTREVEFQLANLPLYDRFIVKMKPAEAAVYSNEFVVESVEASVQAALANAKTTADVQVQEVLKENQLEQADVLNLNVVPEYTVEEQDQNILSITLTEKVDALTFAAELENNEQIEYVQPDYRLELASSSVALTIDSLNDLDIETNEGVVTESDTSSMPIVAVIDSGVDVTHIGLVNTVLDGYDFVNNTDLIYDESHKDEYYHGTHIAGIIAQNAPDAQILPLKAFEGGRAYTSDIIRAIQYAEQNGARIVNMSFGSKDNNRALMEAMELSDMLFICAAGNNRLDVEITPIYPACFDLDNVISVASLNQDLGYSYYSNYSVTDIDIAAIGRNVSSMLPGDEYGEMSGTSQAAAQASAGAAIAIQYGYTDVKSAILEHADRLEHLQNKVVDGRSLNIENIIEDVVNTEIQTVQYEDDFDVHGYQPTPEENWELFSAVPTVQISAGEGHVLVLKENGTVWAWGDNFWGQLGVNEFGTSRTTPVRVIGLKNIRAISTTEQTSYALDNEGRIYSWGLFYLDGPGWSLIPHQRIPIIEGAVDISGAGTSAASILCSDGSVFEWGINKDVNRNNDYVIRQRHELIDIIDISGIYALASDGTVYERGLANPEYKLIDENGTFLYVYPVCIVGQVSGATKFGANDTVITQNGDVWQIGYTKAEDSVTYSLTPISGLLNVSDVYGGYGSYFAKTHDGTVMAWGDNSNGLLLTDATVTKVSVPQECSALGQMTQFAVADSKAFAVHNNGDIYVWGDNADGLIGTGDTVEFYSAPTALNEPFADWMEAQQIQIPCDVTGMKGTSWYTFVAPYTTQYVFSAIGQSLVVFDDTIGTEEQLPIVHNWSNNNKETDACVLKAGERYYIQVSAMGDHILSAKYNMDEQKLASGWYHSLIVQDDGSVLSAGRNSHGQLGIGNQTDSSVAVEVVGESGKGKLNDVISVQVGLLHSLALKSDGTVWAWGNNGVGQAGTNNQQMRCLIPVQPVGEDGIGVLEDVVAIATGRQFSLALKADGRVFAWGENTDGILGVGSEETQIRRPMPVLDAEGNALTNVIAIAAGSYHSMALKSDGTVWCWGKNEYGQLGNQLTADSSIPVQVLGLIGVSKISAGEFHSMALKNDSSVWTWGRNQYGQLGDNTRTTSHIPVQVKGENGWGFLSAITEIDAGIGFSMAMDTTGRCYTWGHNYMYQLGDGTQQSKNAAVQVKSSDGINTLENVIGISAGYDTAMVKTSEGVIWTWGTNSYGQFGNGTSGNVSALSVKAFDDRVEYLLDLQDKYLIVSVENLIDTTMRYKLIYDSSDLNLINVITQKDISEMVPGTYGKLSVDSVSEGEIIFGLNISLDSGKKWSGVMTIFEIQALTDDLTAVRLELLR